MALLAYHYGPGQAGVARDTAADRIALAQKLEQMEDWYGAVTTYDDALAALPATDSKTRWQVRLARSKARMNAGELPESITDLEGQLTEMEQADAPLGAKQEVRSALGTAQYYAAWLMRLEGQPREIWEPEIEAARQNFRLLAEQAETRGEKSGATRNREDLESSVRLARMDLSELQGLPLPSQ